MALIEDDERDGMEGATIFSTPKQSTRSSHPECHIAYDSVVAEDLTEESDGHCFIVAEAKVTSGCKNPASEHEECNSQYLKALLAGFSPNTTLPSLGIKANNERALRLSSVDNAKISSLDNPDDPIARSNYLHKKAGEVECVASIANNQYECTGKDPPGYKAPAVTASSKAVITKPILAKVTGSIIVAILMICNKKGNLLNILSSWLQYNVHEQLNSLVCGNDGSRVLVKKDESEVFDKGASFEYLNGQLHTKIEDLNKRLAWNEDILFNMKMEKSQLAHDQAQLEKLNSQLHLKVQELERSQVLVDNKLKELQYEASKLKRHLAEKEAALSSLNTEKNDLVQNTVKLLEQIKGLRDREVRISVIDFDTVTTDYDDVIPNGYRRLNWDNFHVSHPSDVPGTAYEYGVVSGDYAAYNGWGNPCFISSLLPFSVIGFQAASIWSDDLNVLIEGFDHSGSHIDTHQTTLGHAKNVPVLIDLRGGNFTNLYKLKITTSGGMKDHGRQLAMDDLVVY